MSQSGIYLADLPKPDVVEQLDYEVILADMKQQFNGYQPLLLDDSGHLVVKEAILVTDNAGNKYWQIPVDELHGLFYLDLSSDPTTRQLEIMAYRELLMRQRANDSAVAVMPAYAKGADLDNLALRYGIVRHVVTPATDMAPAVMEKDGPLLRRVLLAYDKKTTAGSEDSYIAHGLDAHGDVRDVSYYSPAPTESVITILSYSANGLASPALLNAVDTYVSAKERRPNSEKVTVGAAEIIPYEVRATITFNEGSAPAPLLAKAKERCETYVEANFMLGRDVTRSALHAQLHLPDLAPGMHEVDIETELPIRVDAHQAAYCTGVFLEYGGRDV